MTTSQAVEAPEAGTVTRVWARALKLSRGCESSRCYTAWDRVPEDEAATMLQWDHVDPDSKYRTTAGRTVEPADMLKAGAAKGGSRYALSTIVKELRKCRVLCANCHAIHSHNQRKG